jgi:hypothetical protein
MTSSLTELRPPPTHLPPTAPTPTRKSASRAGYWAAAIVAVLGLTMAFVWARSAPSPPWTASTASTARRSRAR